MNHPRRRRRRPVPRPSSCGEAGWRRARRLFFFSEMIVCSQKRPGGRGGRTKKREVGAGGAWRWLMVTAVREVDRRKVTVTHAYVCVNIYVYHQVVRILGWLVSGRAAGKVQRSRERSTTAVPKRPATAGTIHSAVSIDATKAIHLLQHKTKPLTTFTWQLRYCPHPFC